MDTEAEDMSPLAEPPIRVLVIAADPLARLGLSGLLADTPELRIVGQVGPTDDLAAAADVYRPDVILWDFGWQQELELDAFGKPSAPDGDHRALPVVGLVGEFAAALDEPDRLERLEEIIRRVDA